MYVFVTLHVGDLTVISTKDPLEFAILYHVYRPIAFVCTISCTCLGYKPASISIIFFFHIWEIYYTGHTGYSPITVECLHASPNFAFLE